MKRPSIYVASKTVHAPRWRELRAAGHNITSTWIDKAGEGESASYECLAVRCIAEATAADVCLLFMQPNEVLKGALLEAGAALAAGKMVHFVGPTDEVSRIIRKHPFWREFSSVEAALAAA